jgi:hypothetical protein
MCTAYLTQPARCAHAQLLWHKLNILLPPVLSTFAGSSLSDHAQPDAQQQAGSQQQASSPKAAVW